MSKNKVYLTLSNEKTEILNNKAEELGLKPIAYVRMLVYKNLNNTD